VRARRERAWLVFLAAGLGWALAYLAAPRHTLISGILNDAGGFACAAAVLVGVRLHRPARPAPWILVAAAQACSGAGDTLFTLFEDVLHIEPFPSQADVFYLAAYPLLTAALFLLVRGRSAGRDLGGLLDAGIVAVGLGLLSWTFLMRPITADETLSLTGQLVSLAYPLGDVALIAVLARLLTTPGARTAAFRLLTAALLLLLAADVGFAVLSTMASYDGGATDALWILAYACWGAAALHPSMRPLTEPVPAAPGARLTFRRFALLGLTTLVAPAVLATQGLTDPATIDWGGVTIGALVLYLLILARVWTMVVQVQDQSVQLAALAHSDPLTGAANRRTWDLALPLAMSAAVRSGSALVVAMIDLDGFKAFNDQFGHQAGDRLLKEATAAWRSLLRAEDLLARYGGEEFCVLLTASTAGEAAATLERLKAATPRGQSFSAGVSVWDGAESPEDLLERADAALYTAKRGGRDRIVVGDAPLAHQRARTSRS
jgi:diguanylate cyclase (GGDEF)-like protein